MQPIAAAPPAKNVLRETAPVSVCFAILMFIDAALSR